MSDYRIDPEEDAEILQEAITRIMLWIKILESVQRRAIRKQNSTSALEW